MGRIKVLGGEHGEELASIKLVESLNDYPIDNVDADIANPEGRKQDKRMIDTNMVLAYPGDPNSYAYEKRQAAEVLRTSTGYDAVISGHNIGAHGMNTCFIDEVRGVSPRVLGFLANLGIEHLLATRDMGIQQYVHGCMLETHPANLGSDFERLRRALGDLANQDGHPVASAGDFIWYRHLDGPHKSQIDPAHLSPDEWNAVRNFEPLSERVANGLGHPDETVHLITWRQEPNSEGYWGELVTPIDAPDDTDWAQWGASGQRTIGSE